MLNQDETPLLYSLVFGEGVVNDATSVVLFNAIQNLDLVHIDFVNFLQFVGKFLYLFATSTFLGIFVSFFFLYHAAILDPWPPLLAALADTQGRLILGFLFTFAFSFLQAGLLSAYVIKKLYFGRLCILKPENSSFFFCIYRLFFSH